MFERAWYRRLFGRVNVGLSGLLAIVVWILITVVANRPALKELIDLTPQKRFTITAETEDLLRGLGSRGLEEPMRIETFFVPLPNTANSEVQIRRRVQSLTIDLLNRLSEYGGDSLEVRHYDVRTEIAAIRERQEALKLGQMQGSFAVVSIGQRKRLLSVPFEVAEIEVPQSRSGLPGGVTPEPRLTAFVGEEAFATQIRTLLAEGAPRIYFGLNGARTSLTAAIGDSYSELLNILGDDGFQVSQLRIDEIDALPSDCAVLALLEPRGLTPKAQGLIVGYLQRGGRVFLNTNWVGANSAVVNPEFEDLFGPLGFGIGRELVCQAIPIGPESIRGGQDARGLQLGAGQMSPHPVLLPLQNAGRPVRLLDARELRPGGPQIKGVSFESILRTDRRLGYLAPFGDAEQPMTNVPTDPRLLRPITVGASIEVEPESGDRDGRMLVYSGVAFLNSQDLIGYNGDLALNSFNWLVDRTELVTVRGNRYRPRILSLNQDQVDRSKSLLRLYVPGLMLGLVVLALYLRRSR